MFHALPIVLALVAQAGPDRPGAHPADLVSALETVIADAVARAEPSVVAIARDKEGRGEETLAIKGRNPAPLPVAAAGGVFGGVDPLGDDQVSFDYGSGVVVGDEGQILTAYHVVKGASRLRVKAAGRQQFEAEIIAADPRSDLAVIVPREGRDLPRPRLTPVPLGDATKLRKGSFLVALGNPYNAARDGRASASWGILANLARRIEPTPRETSNRELQLRHYPTLLQLDSKLNLGMSGGAVVNMRGELVGLTTGAANASGFDAQAGYAVPVDALGRRVIERLIQGKEAEYGFLGIGLLEAQQSPKTNLVGSVQAGTPASDGGLVVGDEILSVGGLPVVDSSSLVAAVNTFTPGVPIRLEIVREGERLTKTVLLSKFPLVGEVIATNRDTPWRGLRVDYLSMLPNGELGPALLRAMSRGGVGVVEVIPGSPADAAGLRVGQIVLEVGGRPVRTPAEFAKAVSGQEGPVDLSTESERKVTVK